MISSLSSHEQFFLVGAVAKLGATVCTYPLLVVKVKSLAYVYYWIFTVSWHNCSPALSLLLHALWTPISALMMNRGSFCGAPHYLEIGIHEAHVIAIMLCKKPTLPPLVSCNCWCMSLGVHLAPIALHDIWDRDMVVLIKRYMSYEHMLDDGFRFQID